MTPETGQEKKCPYSRADDTEGGGFEARRLPRPVKRTIVISQWIPPESGQRYTNLEDVRRDYWETLYRVGAVHPTSDDPASIRRQLSERGRG